MPALFLLPVALLAQITGIVAKCFTQKPWAVLLAVAFGPGTFCRVYGA